MKANNFSGRALTGVAFLAAAAFSCGVSGEFGEFGLSSALAAPVRNVPTVSEPQNVSSAPDTPAAPRVLTVTDPEDAKIGRKVAPNASGALTVIDQNGREARIPEKVNRVATLVIPSASMAIALDRGPERLVGIHPASRLEIADGMLGRFFPAAKSIRADLAGEGFAPNVEALLSARPDLVVQWGDRGAAAVEPLVKVGLPVLTLHSGGGGELAAEWLRILGQGLTGREARGRALAERFLAVRDEIVKTVAKIPEARRPKVVYLYRRHGNAFQVAGGKTTVDSDIRLAGGINLASHLTGYAPVGAEQLLAWAPDVILIGNFDTPSPSSPLGGNTSLRPVSLFRHTPLVDSLPAVKERRVYLYPRGGFRWDPPSHETPLAWRWLLTVFHPNDADVLEKVPLRASLRAEMVESYRQLYGHTLSDSEMDIILRIIDNKDSLHYLEKFSR